MLNYRPFLILVAFTSSIMVQALPVRSGPQLKNEESTDAATSGNVQNSPVHLTDQARANKEIKEMFDVATGRNDHYTKDKAKRGTREHLNSARKEIGPDEGELLGALAGVASSVIGPMLAEPVGKLIGGLFNRKPKQPRPAPAPARRYPQGGGGRGVGPMMQPPPNPYTVSFSYPQPSPYGPQQQRFALPPPPFFPQSPPPPFFPQSPPPPYFPQSPPSPYFPQSPPPSYFPQSPPPSYFQQPPPFTQQPGPFFFPSRPPHPQQPPPFAQPMPFFAGPPRGYPAGGGGYGGGCGGGYGGGCGGGYPVQYRR